MRQLFLFALLLINNFSIAQNWSPAHFEFDASSNTGIKTGLIDCKTIYLHPNKKSVRWLLSPKGGLYVSKDGGNSWNLCSGSNMLPVCELTGMAVDPFNENIIYLATDNFNNCSGLWKSINGGNSFVQLQNFFHNVNEIVISSTNRYLLHIASTDGIYKSLNGGVTFSKVNALPTINFFHIKRNTNKSSHFIYTTSNSAFYYSSDEGISWSQSLIINQTLCHEIGLASNDSNLIYLYNSNHNGEVYVSYDKGATFSNVKYSANPVLNGIDANDTIFNSNNNGFIIPDAVNSNSFYVGSKIIHRYLSSTGFNPTIIYQQQLPGLIHELKWSDGGDTLYACTSGGLYKSIDNALTWSCSMKGISSLQGYALNLTMQQMNVFTFNNGDFIFNDSALISTTNTSSPNTTLLTTDIIDTNLKFKVVNNLVYKKSWKDSTWINFSNKLPTRCYIKDLKIDYSSQPNRLLVLFDGAGIYYTPIDSLRKLKAKFTIGNSVICNGSPLLIENSTTGKIDSIIWKFSGASILQTNNFQPTVSVVNRDHLSILLIAYQNSMSDSCFFSLINIFSDSSLYKTDSCNHLGSFFSDVTLHSNVSNYQWAIASTDSIHTNAYVFPNYAVNAAGTDEALLSKVFSLRDSMNAALRFDYAYTNYSRDYSDTLIIKAKLLCLDKEIILFQRGGSELRTINDSLTVSFHPQINEWRSDSLDLSFGVGAGPMQIIIENKGHYGNNLYLDNLQIDSNYIPTEFQIAVNFFIEGYYLGQRRMRPTLYNAGISNNENETDSFRLQLLDKNNPTQLIYETSGVVKTDGSSQVYIPINYSSKSYYLGLITRNGITVYTKSPIYLSRWGFQEWELRW